MTNNRLSLSPDLKNVLYEYLSLQELFSAQLVSIDFKNSIRTYLNHLFNNPRMFFQYLAREANKGELPHSAMKLINMALIKRSDRPCPIKNALEKDGTFITELFDFYANKNDKEFTIVVNAVSKLTSASRIRELYCSKQIKGYHYALLCDKIQELPIVEISKELLNDYAALNLSTPFVFLRSFALIAVALNIANSVDEFLLQILQYNVACPARNWKNNIVFPVNLSGILSGIFQMKAVVNDDDLTCAVMKNIFFANDYGNYDTSNIFKARLFGANLSYTIKEYPHAVVNLTECDMRFAVLTKEIDSEILIHFTECDLSNTLFTNIKFGVDGLDKCKFTNTHLSACKLSLRDIDHLNARELRSSMSLLSHMNLNGVTVEQHPSTCKNLDDLTKEFKHKLLGTIIDNINSANTLNRLVDTANILDVISNFLTINRSKTFSKFNLNYQKRTCELRDFSNSTMSYKILVAHVKKSAISLIQFMRIDNQQCQRVVNFLEKLAKIDSRTSIFDNLDKDFQDSLSKLKSNLEPLVLPNQKAVNR